MITKYVLDEDEKKEFFENYNDGDILALEYLRDLLTTYNCSEEITDLLYDVIKLNSMNHIIETENYSIYQKYEKQIADLYFNMRNELFEALGITDNDFKKYVE
jgi:hypothetical protein